MTEFTNEVESAVSTTHEWYSYESLPDTPEQPIIRLLSLFPGTSCDPLECSLMAATPFLSAMMDAEAMHRRPIYQYEALSYVWGDAAKTKDLICNKKLLKITASLATALRAIRQSETSRTLWADGICINQDDEDERASQVLLMSSIYSQATQVICWLGPNDDDGHAAFTFSLADKIATRTKLDSISTDGLASVNLKEFNRNQSSSQLAQNLSAMQGGSEKLVDLLISNIPVHIAPLLQRSWFSRMWIRQEVGYASKALIVCGKSEVDFKALHWLVFWAVTFDEVSGRFSLPTRSLSTFESYGHSPLVSFLELLVQSRQFESTNPRDKVFALLSHPSAWVETVLDGERDYCVDVVAAIRKGASREEVAHEVAKARVQLHHDLHHNDNDSGHDCPCGNVHDSVSFTLGVRQTAGSTAIDPIERSPEKIKTLANILNQSRRLDELENPRLHPVYRIGSGSSIFAALSSRILEPNYRESVGDINFNLAVNLLRTSEGAALFPLLCAVQHDPIRTTALENEDTTWVPRWDRSDIHCQLGFSARISPGFRPYSGGNSGENGKVTMTISWKFLSLQGILVDTILSSTEPIRPHSSPHSQACLGIWNSVLGFNLSPNMETDVQKLRSYCRVSTADNFDRARPSIRMQPMNDAELFNSFIAFWSQMYNHEQSILDPSVASSSRVFPVPKELEQGATRAKGNDFWDLALLVSRNRRLFSTQRGFLGLGPEILESGDVVCIFPQLPVPLVLRPVDGHFLLVGECYVDGIMDGEEADAAKVQTFELH
ncbi:Heterokaryon incompatibility protein 6,OR allele [Lachnellula subtilissima]|uniref:Heterokaryon incompatibility protein 6,OR allele n=1 Tax=Lachnellula subtilissima TaxID=602034 RepID=A0A8H8RWM9_9HELO|nr:Heterokaryon incompatibility protein 6,OR allele [Lachnellula subtilissima]